MLWRSKRQLLTPIALITALAAQAPQTFVVDINNGPSSHYTEINGAVAAVPDGSILLVRPGNYAPVDVNGQGLTILCDPGVAMSSLVIRNTTATQTVVARGIAARTLSVSNTDGPVTLHGFGSSIFIWSPPLSIINSRQVFVRNYVAAGFTGATSRASGCEVHNSAVVFEGCELRGSDGHFNPLFGSVHAAAGLRVLNNSDVQLMQTSVFGGNGLTSAIPGAPAIQVNATVRVTGNAGDQIEGGLTPGASRAYAIVGASPFVGGTARVAPTVTLSSPHSGGPLPLTLTRPSMPGLTSVDAVPGGNLTATWSGLPGNFFALALGLRAPASNLPGVLDPLWIDLQNISITASGIAPASGTLQSQVAVPNFAGLRGVELVWQSASLSATATIAASNPSPAVIY